MIDGNQRVPAALVKRVLPASLRLIKPPEMQSIIEAMMSFEAADRPTAEEIFCRLKSLKDN